MRSLQSAEGRRGLLEWAEPVIFDRLIIVYRRRLGEGADALTMARLHGRVWRALIAGDEPNFVQSRYELIGALDRRGLDAVDLAQADAQTMAELLAIVLARFKRSERVASSYHHALIEVGERLTHRRGSEVGAPLFSRSVRVAKHKAIKISLRVARRVGRA